MIRRPRFLSPQERVKSPPTHVNLQIPRKQSLLMQTGPYVFDCSQVIGKGQYSVVYKGYEQNKPNQIVAVKVITIQPDNPIQIYMIENEINTLKLLDSPHILKLLYHHQNNKQVFLVTEFCNKGDLLLKLQRSLILEEDALQYTLQIAKALQTIHQHNIMHGDIKSANILLSDRCVLADFGFAQKIDQAQQTYIIGTPLYMAPEVLFENNINCQADMWSLGCVLYEMVYGQSPFYSENNDILKVTLKKFKENGKLSFPNTGVSKKIQALILYLIKVDPNQRLTPSDTIALLEPRNVDEQIKLNENQIKIKHELLQLDDKEAQIEIKQQQQSNFNESNTNSNSQSNQTPIQDIQSTPDNQNNNVDNNSQDEHRRSTKNSHSSAKRKKLLQQHNNLNQRNVNSQINNTPAQHIPNSDVKKVPHKNFQNLQQISCNSNNNINNNISNNNNNSNNINNNNNNSNPANKTISLLDLVNYFYKVYQLILNGKELKLAFIYLKLVNIYYLAYLEEQSKQQKKVIFVSCQNDYFELEREIKNKHPVWLKEEEFQKIFHSKFVLTQDFLKYSLNYLNKAAFDQHQDEKITEKIKKTLQIISILVSNERSSTLQLDQQIIRLHSLNYKV